jgi:hypothetical protein
LSGNIFYESEFGADSPPDWDGSFSTDAHPLHNGRGPDDYTWRNDNSQHDPGRLDYILYTDSVIQEANKFILNTVDMTTAELLKTGLQTYDITVDLEGVRYDHLPVVVDFRMFDEPPTMGPPFDVPPKRGPPFETPPTMGPPVEVPPRRGPPFMPGDFDLGGNADGQDFLQWQRGGSPNPLSASDLADWESNYGTTAPLSATSAAVPEPTTCTLALAALCLAMSRRRAT